MAAKTGAEIASAYVTLQVTMPGVKNDVRKHLGGIDMSSIGGQMGSRLADGIKKSLKYSAAAVGGVLAAGIGASLVKGFSRLNSIDQATAKLRGLGNSASDVDKIMANALASVKGTAFGLDSAATTAAGAVAAGIKPGRELEAVLKSVANSAAASGSGMDEMGSIYNKVASLGKAQNDSLQQVADRGLPIYQKLSEQLGVTTDEVFKMASAGEIGFAEFESAMTAAAGTVASEMGNTVSGSWANFMSSLGRAGAGVLGGVWSSLAPVLQAATNAMGPLEEIAGQVGEKIGKFLAPALEWLIDSLNNGVDFSMLSPLGLIFKSIAPVLPIVSDTLGQVAKIIGGALAAVLPPLMPALVSLVEVFGDLLATILPPLVPLIATLAGAFVKILTPILPLVGVLVGALGPIIEALAPLLVVLAKAITPVITLIADLFTPVIAFLSEALTWVVGIIVDAISNAIPWLGQAFQNVWNVIKPVFDGIATVAKWVFENILQPAFLAVQIGFAILGGIFQGIWESVLKPVFDAVGAVFKWLWDTIISVIIAYIVIQVKVWGAIFTWLWNTILKPVFDAIGKVFQWIYRNIILPIVAGIQIAIKAAGAVFTWLWQNAVKPAIDGVASVFRWLFENIVKPIWDGISNTIKGVWENGIKPVIDTLSKVIKSDPKAAFEAARDAIGKAWEGIQDLAKKPVKFVIETVINGLIGTVNKILPEGMKLPTVPLPKGFRVGGYTGDVGVNTAAGVVHGREFVTRAESTAKIMRKHPGVLEHMNRYGEIPGYRKGGLVDPLPRGSWSQSQPYHSAHNGIDLAAPMGTRVYAAADGVVDLAGVVPMGGNEVHIQHPNGLATRYSHLSRFATGVGKKVKAGHVIGYVGSTGMSTGPHLHYMVHNPGTGPMGYGNHVNPAPYMGLQGKDLGEAGGAQSILDGLVDFAVSKVKDAFPEGGMWIDIAAGLAKNAASTMAKVFNPFAASDGHTLLYDNGGWLQPGKHLVENKSGRPEPILTASQWDALVDSRSGGGLAAGDSLSLVVDGHQFDAYVEARADSRIRRAVGPVSGNRLRAELGVI